MYPAGTWLFDIFSSSSISVTSVTQDHFYSINLTQDQEISNNIMQYHLTGLFDKGCHRPTGACKASMLQTWLARAWAFKRQGYKRAFKVYNLIVRESTSGAAVETGCSPYRETWSHEWAKILVFPFACHFQVQQLSCRLVTIFPHLLAGLPQTDQISL